MVIGFPVGTAGALQERTRSEAVTVGTTSIVVAPVRHTEPIRRSITIRNTSDDPTKIITISFGDRQAIDNAGIVLKQFESFTDSQDGNTSEGYLPYQGQINAICAVANGTLSIYER
jgi:hypothetical protein